MNKWWLSGIAVVALLAAAAYKVMAQTGEENKTMDTQNAKILIAYYSYSGNTKEVAEAIQKEISGDLFEIKADGTYPDEYRPMTEQAKKEIDAGFRPKLTTSVADMAQYDIVFIGSPNWWGTITPQVSSFLESYDLSGKTVIPFVTHGGGGQQNTIADLTAQCKGCKVNSDGWVGYGSRTLGIGSWLEGLGFKK